MKYAIAVLALLAAPALAQVSNPSIVPVSSAPSGGCTQTLPLELKTPDGTLYTCQNGTWAVAAGSVSGTVGSGTANSLTCYPSTGTVVGACTGINTDGSGNLTATSAKAKIIDEGGQVFNVVAYGAKGDGTTDDRLAIQSAATAASSSCGVVYFPQAIFLVNSNPNSGVSNQGIIQWPVCVGMAGPGTIKVGAITTWDSLFWNNASGGTIVPATFRDVTIDLNGTNNPINSAPGNTNRHNVFFIGTNTPRIGSQGLTFDNITFENGNGVWTISANVVDNTTVKNCRWLNWGVGGNVAYDTSELYLTGFNLTVIGNLFQGYTTSTGTTTGGHGLNTAIEVHGTNIAVTDNVVNGFKIGVVYDPDNTVTNNTPGSNVNIGNNSIIAYDYGVVGAADSSGYSSGIRVHDNTITITRASTEWGINYNGQQAGIQWVDSLGTQADLAITHNTIAFGAETPGYVWNAGLSCIWVSGNVSLTNINIAGNSCDNSPANGIFFSPGAGTGQTYQGVHIDGNTIINPGQESAASSYSQGIYAGIGTSGKWLNSTITNNVITDNQSTATMSTGIIWFGATGDNAPSQVVMAGNQVNYTNIGVHSPYSFNNTSPLVNLTWNNFYAPSWAVNGGTIANADNPPIGSTVFDPAAGKDYVLTTQNSAGGVFSSGGTPYIQGNPLSAGTITGQSTNTWGGYSITFPNLTGTLAMMNNGSQSAAFYAGSYLVSGTGYTSIDNSGNLRGSTLQLQQLASDPSSPSNGLLWYNVTSNQLKAAINSAVAVLGAAPLSGTTASIGGSALLVNACTSGTVSITGATTGMVAVTNPSSDPNSGATQDYDWYARVTSAGTVTVYECAIVAGTPAATTFNVRVIQ